ncbi:MAG: YHS domain protein [Bacteroidetes bacterium]|nr:YHS domain protein [Bacteroidota bacterium]
MKSKIYLPVGLMLFASWLGAQPADVRLKQFNIEKTGLALQGYDPVAYFESHKAMEGKKEITAWYEGITYRFSSDKNKATFLTNPLSYEPQYGGWCAFAMGAKGEKVEVDPETFKISNGKLYLFYNHFFNNTLKDWNKDEGSLKTNADQNWKKIITYPHDTKK